jgi:hypothetical protein
MIAIEVIQNGKRITLAGGYDLEGGSVTVSVDGPRPDGSKGRLLVFGVSKYVEGKQQSMFTWLEREVIAVGDEIILRVKDVSEADRPEKIEDPSQDE